MDKYSAYATQASDPQLKQLFNAYAGQEQQHGEGIFNYMQSNGMYNAQQ